MKIFSLAMLLTIFSSCLLAQNVVKRTNIINPNFSEKYHVIKPDKKIRHGKYELYLGKNVIGEGEYLNGKKSGIWTYYSNQTVSQKYDYDNDALIYNNPDNSVSYYMEDIKAADSVINPYKIGGKAGFMLLVTNFSFREFMAGVPEFRVPGTHRIDHWFYLDENGKLINWEAKVNIDNKIRSYKQAITDISAEHLSFSPAIVNGKKRPSIIIYQNPMRTAIQRAVTVGRTPIPPR